MTYAYTRSPDTAGSAGSFPRSAFWWALWLVMCIGVFLPGAPAHAADELDLGDSSGSSWLEEEQEFLKVDEAFRLSTSISDDREFVASWEMPDGYYLYRHQFEFAATNGVAVLGPAEIPAGKEKFDDWFGDVEVYYHSAQAVVPILSLTTPAATRADTSAL